jgi:hypothetical protein
MHSEQSARPQWAQTATASVALCLMHFMIYRTGLGLTSVLLIPDALTCGVGT